MLLITGEYATGMIRASLAAVPRRLPVLWAKAAVFALTVTLVLTVPAVLGAFLVGQSILSAEHLQTALGDPGVACVPCSAARSTSPPSACSGWASAPCCATPPAASPRCSACCSACRSSCGFLPASWADPIDKYLPITAGEAVTSVHADPGALGPWTGFGLFCVYAAVLLALAADRSAPTRRLTSSRIPGRPPPSRVGACLVCAARV